MDKVFKGLTLFQKAELLIMMLLAFVIPFHWFAAQCGEVALLVCAVLKLVFDQKFKLNKQQLKLKWAYIIFALTWVIYLVGMIYTTNQAEGWNQVSKKLGFLIFPVIFIISDMLYLNKTRLKAIGQSLVLGCILFFVMNLSYAIYDYLFNGADSSRFFDQELMKWYYVHHSYLSMYAGLGMMFCFMEIFGEGSRKVKIFNAIAYLILLVFTILVRSRAGMLCLVILFILQWIWLTFIIKKKKIGLAMGCVFVLALIGAIIAFPQSFSRITATISDVKSEHSSDHRLVQFKGYKSVLTENWLLGVGTGDRTDATQASYRKYKENLDKKLGPKMVAAIDEAIADYWYEPDDSMRIRLMAKAEKCDVAPDTLSKYLVEYQFTRFAIDNGINAHNMFFETLISVGIFGVLLLLSYFVIPLVLWIRMKKFDMLYFAFLMMIGFNALFESIFEVQLGIIFFCFFNALLFYMSFRPNNSLEFKSF